MFSPKKIDLSLIHESCGTKYLKEFLKYDFSEFIEMKANCLGGNWKGKNDKTYGLFIFEDHTQHEKLKSYFQISIDYEDNARMSPYCFSSNVRDNIISPIISRVRFLSNFDIAHNRKQGALLVTVDDDCIPKNFDLSNWKEHQCSLSNLRPKQFMQIMMEINKLPNNERDKELAYYEKRVKESVKSFLKCTEHCDTFQEKPYRIRFFGNDDSVYTMNYRTREDAWNGYLKLKKAANLSNPRDFFLECGLVNDV